MDWHNFTDKRAVLDPDRFGYLSLHHIVSLGACRTHLPEYSRFKGLKAEFQTRSVLQHAWAEIEHDLGYKTREGVPECIRRRFSRLAGLLELADQEFQGIRNDLSEYERSVPDRIQEAPETVGIDKASLAAFLNDNPIVDELDQEIANLLKLYIKKEYSHLDDQYEMTERRVAAAKALDLETIQDLETLYTQHKQEISAFASEFLTEEDENPPGSFTPVGGTSFLYLLRVLAAKREDTKAIEQIES